MSKAILLLLVDGTAGYDHSEGGTSRLRPPTEKVSHICVVAPDASPSIPVGETEYHGHELPGGVRTKASRDRHLLEGAAAAPGSRIDQP